MLKELKQFLFRGNVIDLAVGVVIGAAFGTIVSSLVADIITPLIAAIAKVPDFSELFFTINGSRFMYGNFVNAVVSFLLVGGSVFFIVVKPMNIIKNRAKKEEEAKEEKKMCKECLSQIPKEAKRCAFCGQPCQD
jgi:large conductance mechanosensitive channel